MTTTQSHTTETTPFATIEPDTEAAPMGQTPVAPPPDLLETEWLITNGTGAFAMGSVAGVNTRRYHGLLNAAAHPPVGRVNTLNAVNDAIHIDGQTYELACHEFETDNDSTIFHPSGYKHLAGFKKSTACQWTYRVGPLNVVKTLRLVHGRQLGELTWTLENAVGSDVTIDEPVTLSVAPLLALRDFHHLRRQGDRPIGEAFGLAPTENGLTVTAEGAPDLHLACQPGAYHPEPDAWYRFHRRIEASRHQDCTEDLFIPGRFEHTFSGIAPDQPQTLTLRFGIEPLDGDAFDQPDPREDLLAGHVEHLHGRFAQAPASRNKADAAWDAQLEGHLATLALAADDFVVRREVDGQPMTTILAGYPWFADWGRDTMISLPGLLLTTGRYGEALQTLRAYGRHIRRGLILNRFDDYGAEPHYNTVDASLWFVHACLEYLGATGDIATWDDELAGYCTQVLDAYRDGTDNDIYMDKDGLISAGNANTQLTWMDAQNSGIVFTPRHGKAVEINALWYRGLVGCATALEESDPDTAAGYTKLARKAKSSFKKAFWDDDLGCLIDHISDEGPDRSIRLNQVFAASLPESMLTKAQQKSVLRVVHDELLTPVGLRTLAPDDPEYRGLYEGAMFDRDSAYHRGTTWAWPLGAYVEGHLRAHNFSATSRRHGRAVLSGLLEELGRHSVGQLHEVFDGDEPHRPGGCMAQAWSVAEVLRAAMMVKKGSA
ncbi:MAG: amylo-alpha-1,6-glucosidase [Planctomycetota bacterium]|jgi:glycogen debranching enzyme